MTGKSNDGSEEEQASRLELFLQKGVVVGDPMSLEGLTKRVADDAVPIDGIPYDTKRTTGDRVDCALCGRRHNHFKGFVVDFEGEIRATVGVECAEHKLFEAGAWEEMAANAERRKLKVLYDERSAPTVRRIDELQMSLERCHQAGLLIDRLLQDVASELPHLHDGLVRATQDDGRLRMEVRKEVTKKDQDGFEREVVDYSLKTLITMESSAPFRKGGLAGPIKEIAKELKRARTILDVEAVTMAQQAEAFRKIRILRQDFAELRREYELSAAFLSMRFWDLVCKWGRAYEDRQGNYRIKKRLVRHSDPEWIFGEVSIPDEQKYDLGGFEVALEIWPRL